MTRENVRQSWYDTRELVIRSVFREFIPTPGGKKKIRRDTGGVVRALRRKKKKGAGITWGVHVVPEEFYVAQSVPKPPPTRETVHGGHQVP